MVLDARCPLSKTAHLWRLALAATGDPAFGLKLTKQYKHTMFHALGYGLSASSTLKEAFERVQRYSHVVSDAVEYQFLRLRSGISFHPRAHDRGSGRVARRAWSACICSCAAR
jgi:hypothetical protein